MTCPKCGSRRVRRLKPSGATACENCGRLFGRNGREISVEWI